MERFELPEGWEWRRLGAVACYINGAAFKPSDWGNEGLPIIRIQNLTNPDARFNYFAGKIDDRFRVSDGDILVSWSATLEIFFWNRGPAWLNQHTFRVNITAPDIDKGFLFCALKVVIGDIRSRTHGLTMQHIKRKPFEDTLIPVPPLCEQQRLVARIEAQTSRVEHIRKAQRELETELRGILAGYYAEICADAKWKPLAEVAPQVRRPVSVETGKSYPELGIRSFGKGTFHKPAIAAEHLGSKRIYHIHPGDLIFNNVFGWEGAVAVVKPEDAGRVGSHRFITCVPKANVATTPFLYFHFTTQQGLHDLGDASPGGAGRNRTLGLTALGNIRVPVPDYNKQMVFTRLWEKVETTRRLQIELASDLAAYVPALLAKAFRGEL